MTLECRDVFVFGARTVTTAALVYLEHEAVLQIVALKVKSHQIATCF